MKVLEVTELSGCTKRLSIELEETDLRHEEEEFLAELKENAALPGFRKGHVPISLLKKRFRKSINKGARDNAQKEALKKAVEDLGLKTIGEPSIKEESKEEGKEESAESEVPRFTADIEFIPPFELGDYRNLKVEEPEIEVTETHVAEALDNLRDQNALLRGIDNRPAQEGDVVTVKVTGTIDGEAFPEGTHDNYSFRLGEKRHLPGFEEAMAGKSLDESFSVDIVIPENYQVERLRGKTAHFEIQLNEIRERILPDLDDEFAKDMGFESMAELKSMVRERLELNLQQRKEQARRGNVVRQLLDSTKFDAPPSLVQARFQYNLAMQEQQLQRMGSSLSELGDRKETYMKDNLVRADMETRASLILQKIAELEKIEVTQEQFANEVAQIASSSGRDPRAFIQNMMRNGLDRMLQQEMLEGKVIDFLLGKTDAATIPQDSQESDDHDHDHEGHEHEKE